MRKNRKRSKRLSAIAVRSMYLGSVMVMLFVVVILNMLANSRCTQMRKAIGEKERTLGRLEEEYKRESARWDEMCTAENLERRLRKLGMSMRYHRAEQVVRMRSDGVPYPGQAALATAKRDSRNLTSASVHYGARR